MQNDTPLMTHVPRKLKVAYERLAAESELSLSAYVRRVLKRHVEAVEMAKGKAPAR